MVDLGRRGLSAARPKHRQRLGAVPAHAPIASAARAPLGAHRPPGANSPRLRPPHDRHGPRLRLGRDSRRRIHRRRADDPRDDGRVGARRAGAGARPHAETPGRVGALSGPGARSRRRPLARDHGPADARSLPGGARRLLRAARPPGLPLQAHGGGRRHRGDARPSALRGAGNLDHALHVGERLRGARGLARRGRAPGRGGVVADRAAQLGRAPTGGREEVRPLGGRRLERRSGAVGAPLRPRDAGALRGFGP